MEEETGMEHREQADHLEREAEKLEQESARVSDKIDDAREDWRAKEGDVSVPGAQPDLEKELDEEEQEEKDGADDGGDENDHEEEAEES